MKKNLLLISLLMSAFFIYTKSSISQNETCKQILKDGIFDVENINLHSYNKLAYASSLMTMSKSVADKKTNFSGNAVIKGIPVGADFNQAEYNYWVSKINKSEKFEQINQHSESIIRSTGNKDIINAWKGCISGGGFDLFFEEKGDFIILNFDWIPSYETNSITIQSIIIEGADVKSGDKYLEDYTISCRENGKILLQRKNIKTGILAILIPEKGETISTYFPPKIKLPPIVNGYKIAYTISHRSTQRQDTTTILFGQSREIYNLNPGADFPSTGGLELNDTTFLIRARIADVAGGAGHEFHKTNLGGWDAEISTAEFDINGIEWFFECKKIGEVIIK